MLDGYFNYFGHTVEGKWERGGFVRRWRAIYRADRRWVPPYHPLLRRALLTDTMPHVVRQRPALLYIEALPGRRRSDDSIGGSPMSATMEVPVCAAVVLADPRRNDGTAYLGLLHCVNDAESMERFFGMVMEQAWAYGARRVVGPVGLSPHLQSGVLEDYFHVVPPLHTPYNPPYLPEVIQSVLEPVLPMRLYHAPVVAEDRPLVSALAMRYAQPGELAATLLPLMTEAGVMGEMFVAPDEVEVGFLAAWLGTFPLTIVVVEEGDMPVGLVVLQPDLASNLLTAKGGRNPLWRLWLAWRACRATVAGRLLCLNVTPQWRGQGIGRYLWGVAMQEAHALGWQSLSVGPVPEDGPAAVFLGKMGASPRQQYRLYASEL